MDIGQSPLTYLFLNSTNADRFVFSLPQESVAEHYHSGATNFPDFHGSFSNLTHPFMVVLYN